MIQGIPNLFIVGAAKAGTSALLTILEQHPDIFVSPIKEPNYFNQEIDPKKLHATVSKDVFLDDNYFVRHPKREVHLALVQNKENYLRLFQTPKSFSYYCEASTGYLYSPVAAKNISRFNPDAKIIILLREPVQRTVSHFLMDVSRNVHKQQEMLSVLKQDYEHPNKTFLSDHLYIDLSLYSEQILRYLEFFPTKQICILRQEDLIQHPENILKRLSDFLEIDCSGLNSKLTANETLIPRFSWMKKLKKLRKFTPISWIKFMKQKRIFFDKPVKQNLDPEALEFIRSQVESDWKKTQTIIDNQLNG